MHKVSAVFLFFILISNSVYGQKRTKAEQNSLDSLNAITSNSSNHDTIIANALLAKVDYYYLTYPDSAILFCEMGKNIFEKHNHTNGKSGSYAWMGYLLESQGDIEGALEYMYRSLKIFEETNNKEEQASVLNNIGFVFYNQHDWEKSLEYFESSLRIKEKLGNKQAIAMSYNNLAVVYVDMGNMEKSFYYLSNSLKLYKEMNDKPGISMVLNNIADNYRIKGEFDIALGYLQNSLKIELELGDLQGEAISYENMGKIYFKQGKIDLAEKFALQSLNLSKKLGYPDDIKQAALLLSSIYEKQNKGIDALQMYRLYITMRDSLNNGETQKNVAKQQAKYKYEKLKAIDDIENDKRLGIEKEAKEKQQVITMAISIGLAFVLAFLFFVFNRLKVARRQKKLIEQQNSIVESAKNMLELKNKEITDSISYAKRIQTAILPSEKLVKQYLKKSFILYKPKDIVAGDFYWLEHKNESILFAAADCTGHGVPGAMVSVVCNNALNRSVREQGLTDPGMILDKTRELVLEEFEKSDEDVNDGMDIALCSIIGNKLSYAGAYNPLWIIRNNECMEWGANKQPIGKFENQEKFTTHNVDLLQGDTIYIFTDGFIDQFGGEKGKKFKAKALKELLLNVQHKTMEEQQILIQNAFEKWKENVEQIDDVCLIGVRF
ncbi:MAG: tetratricopeptide repeat protein [Bacteroidetes bacterium]|nr:tetratricopeptide repeat protein [Bacteroidota bacterium]